MTNAYYGPPALSRQAAVALVALMTIVSSGVSFTINKITGTTALRSERVGVIKSSSGSGLAVDGYGNTTASGWIATNKLASCNTIDSTSTGMLICGTDDGASAITFAGAEGIYVNQKGDTMTGTLTINVAGSTGLDVKDNAYANNLTATGNLIAQSTVSGSILRGTRREWASPCIAAESGSALSAGTGKLVSNIIWPAQFSGATLRSVRMRVSTLGTTNPSIVKLINITKGKSPFTPVGVQVDSQEYDSNTAATAYTIDGNIVAAGGDLITTYVSQVSTTAPTGVSVCPNFRIP